MPAKEYLCKVTKIQWLTPTVVDVQFIPSKKFKFDAGQFLSIVVPNSVSNANGGKPLRRAYSFALPHEQGWGLCIKVVENGPGSNYMSSLKVGDTFKAFAPYGHFVFNQESPRDACFISTGTGVAPFIAMARSKAFQENPPAVVTNIFGARTEDEIIYPGEFERLGVREINAISRPSDRYTGFKGRVTDYLRSLPADWPWELTDFYLCGNGEMVAEVRKLLRGRGVPQEHIHQEVYFSAPDRQLGKVVPIREVA